ncbi:MAG: DUF1854 domain-containing protein [Gemmatimonadetes bacterium]|nr:DUF1854 domain-containing protein [Gemmatimonadota bacterium]
MVRLRKDLEKQEKLKLERRADGQLWAVSNGEERAVRLHRCFPWSEPGRYLSLRDTENEEFALVRSLDDLEPASRSVLQDAIAEVGFVLEVERITEVEEEIEIRTWKVETRQGPRSFQTRLDDWPMDVPGGGILIRDVAGDLYHVADPDKLDAKSRTWLWAFLD